MATFKSNTSHTSTVSSLTGQVGCQEAASEGDLSRYNNPSLFPLLVTLPCLLLRPQLSADLPACIFTPSLPRAPRELTFLHRLSLRPQAESTVPCLPAPVPPLQRPHSETLLCLRLPTQKQNDTRQQRIYLSIHHRGP